MAANRSPTEWVLIRYIGEMLLPLVVIGLASTDEIFMWLRTGICPAGPMDRPAAPCGPFSFFSIVFLGGWAAFVFLPLLLAWWTVATVGFGRRRNRKRNFLSRT